MLITGSFGDFDVEFHLGVRGDGPVLVRHRDSRTEFTFALKGRRYEPVHQRASIHALYREACAALIIIGRSRDIHHHVMPPADALV